MSMLDGDTEIPMHTGYFKGLMRYMLPLQVPQDREKCFLCVNGLKYTWQEGVGVLWDDMFPHRVENRTDEVRIVLYMDIKRSNRPSFLDAIVHFTSSEMEKSPDVQAEIKRSERKQSISKSES
jgi:aspartyl/asparaginyl beta-hydroxylase (cupin superfamily)